jgi:ribosome maturation protein Sdo1
MLQEQSTRMENWSVRICIHFDLSVNIVSSESKLDEVLQISNVFVNVSKGEVAKTNDLQKAFGKTNVEEIVKEVRSMPFYILKLSSAQTRIDPQERRSSSRRKRT